ncbi:IS3 family transposase [Armatimonas sp.]|uniref:IS3 family transposase n=1 Tax=Armatimonas sp. TaxID=1872638 RepID=UPI003752F007
MTAPQKRSFVSFAKTRGLSQRKACRLVKLSRSVARYRVRPGKDDEAQLVERIQTIAKKNCRRGYRLAHHQLRREGLKVNHKRIHRLWRREGLSVRPRRSRSVSEGKSPWKRRWRRLPTRSGASISWRTELWMVGS